SCALIETARCADARLQLCESARGNLPFQRSIYFFRLLCRAASFRVVLGPAIDADKEIALALQRGERRIGRALRQSAKISHYILRIHRRRCAAFPSQAIAALSPLRQRRRS